MKREKVVLGRIELVDFPDLALFGIEAKIDTGAYSSSIHCHDIYENKENGNLCFKLLDPSHMDYHGKEHQFPRFSKKAIKSSTGIPQLRYIIKTNIKIGKKTYTTDFSLSDRSSMKFPVLLGRKVLTKRFLVDVSKKHLLSTKKAL